jgi:hypothetical protein
VVEQHFSTDGAELLHQPDLDKNGSDLISDALPKKPFGSGGIRLETQL